MERQILPEIDVTKCVQCGACVSLCPEQILTLTDQGITFVRPEACTYCGTCELSCPAHAVILRYAIVWDEDMPH